MTLPAAVSLATLRCLTRNSSRRHTHRAPALKLTKIAILRPGWRFYPPQLTHILTRRLRQAMLTALAGGLMAEAQQDKRATRRFALRLPVSVSYTENGSQEQPAQTRDVSARGICFYIDAPIANGAPIEFTLTLPPEITLTESIRVRCRGKVVRVDNGGPQGKVAVAAVIDEYEFLSES